MKNIGIIGLLIVLMTTIAWAQGHDRKGKERLNPEAKAALKELKEKEIYPARKAMYDDFMGQLSAEDKAFLAAKRQENEAIKAEAKTIRQQLRADRKAGKEIDHKTAMAPIREKREALLTSMKPFLESQQAVLEGIMRAMKEQQKEWKAKKKAILEQHTTAEERQKMEEKRDRMKAKMEEKAKEKGLTKEDKQLRKAAMFVLWDGEMKERKGHGHKKGGKGKRRAE